MSIAELWFKYGDVEDEYTIVEMAKNTRLILFIDGSSVFETTKHTILYETCLEN